MKFRRPARGVLVRGAAAGLLLWAAPARASGGVDKRTPVAWADDTPCMTVVDRSRSPLLHFPYQIPVEDTALDPEDLPGSRRHQFLAFASDHPYTWLPDWVSWADVEAWDAWSAGLGYRPWPATSEDVLETSGLFLDGFARVTPDDERRLILFAEAHKGVFWDTTGLPAGPYTIRGYTWHPPYNVWSRRPGVVHVVDGPGLADVAPAAALTDRIGHVYAEDGLVLSGCARALPGSTIGGSWALADGPEPLVWTPFAEGVPLDGDAIALAFVPPPETVYQDVMVRVEVSDPLDRTFAAHLLQSLVILPGSEACDQYPKPPPCVDEAPTTGEGDAESGTFSDGATPSEGTTGAVETGASGCGCRATGAPAWLVLGLARRRRRVRSA